MNGYIEVVKLLLSQDGIEINMQERFSDTALSTAARNGYTEVVKLLLSQDGI